MADLSELLPVGAVRLDVEADTWREAVRAAGGAMVDEGVATDGYTAEMIRNVEENGPYVVVAPGLALAHARPSPAVLRTGLSWVRLARPVPFGHETNDPVGTVVGLAARDAAAHTGAMADLARLLSDPATAAALRRAPAPADVHALLRGGGPSTASRAAGARGEGRPGGVPHKILTVCGNGLGTSLFLRNTLEQVLDRWRWSEHVTVEATDTVSARGRAREAVAVLTSAEIAAALGDLGVPVGVVEDFTSVREVDAALREIYDV